MRVLQSVVPFLAAATLQAATLESTVSFVDGRELLENPGCGHAGGTWLALSPGMSTNGVDLCSGSRNCTKLWSMHKFSKGYVYGDTYAVQTNHYAHITNFVGGADIPLDANALLAVSNSFLKCRRNGGTCIPRFAYTWDGWGGAEPDDFEMIIAHIHQLGAVLSQFRDVVPAVECGIIGAYGEMHTSRYAGNEYQNRVVGAWLESLPEGMSLLVRSPPVWMKYLNTTTPAFIGGGMDTMDQTLRSRMGFYNDGYLGTDYDYGTWGGGGGTTTWSRDEGRAFLRGQAVPYGGEFAGVSTNYFDENVHLLDPSRFNIVAEWYDTHLSYLRTIRAYDMTIVQRLTNAFFSSSAWAFDGMPGLSEYDGVDLRKFCEDHMGFRYVVRDVSFEGRTGGARLDVEIENTGFGQLLFDDLIEVVLSSGGVSAKAPIVGDPQASFRTIRGGATAVVSLDFDYPANLQPGEYDVFLRVSAPLADEVGDGLPRRPVRFANDGCWDASLRANRICRVSIGDGYDFAEGTLWFSWNEDEHRSIGGKWGADGVEGGFPVRSFDLDSGVPSGKSGDVCVTVTAESLGEIPCPSGDMASFVFLGDRQGAPVPHGYCAGGWRRLYGVEVEDGAQVEVKIRVAGKFVQYSVNGTVLRDESGQRWLPSAAKPSRITELSFAGSGESHDFFGIIGSDNGAGSFRILLR